jgi:hypothetical protein
MGRADGTYIVAGRYNGLKPVVTKCSNLRFLRKGLITFTLKIAYPYYSS